MRRISFTVLDERSVPRLLEISASARLRRVGTLEMPWADRATPAARAAADNAAREGAAISWRVGLGDLGAGLLPQGTRVTLVLGEFPAAWPGHLGTEPADVHIGRVTADLSRMGTDARAWTAFLRLAPAWVRRKLHFAIPSRRPRDPRTPSVGRVHRLLRTLKGLFPDLHAAGVRGDETHDPLGGLLDVHSPLPPDFSTIREETRPRLSVVIPTYNQARFTERVLGALARQTLPPDEFEVIVVDDGSTDDTAAKVRAFLTQAAPSFQGRLLIQPRPAGWREPLALHRAGLARNAGAEQARGPRLLFLDSDILVDSGFLEGLLAAAEGADVLQCPRVHLSPAASRDLDAVDPRDPPRDTYVEEENYWRPFFEARDWVSLPFYWKYTCTYCLSIDAGLFWRLGGFDRSIVSYGFEDTQLGYEAHRAGARFRLWDRAVYHLTDEAHGARFGLFSHRRYRALAVSAQAFYLNHLDPEIFEHFPFLMTGPGPVLRAWWRIQRFARAASHSAST